MNNRKIERFKCFADHGPYSLAGISKRQELNKQGICWTCRMRHKPFCDDRLTLCRVCGCGREWHPLNGPCRVGPETEFELHNCYCKGYIPKDNLEYLESLVDKNEIS